MPEPLECFVHAIFKRHETVGRWVPNVNKTHGHCCVLGVDAQDLHLISCERVVLCGSHSCGSYYPPHEFAVTLLELKFFQLKAIICEQGHRCWRQPFAGQVFCSSDETQLLE